MKMYRLLIILLAMILVVLSYMTQPKSTVIDVRRSLSDTPWGYALSDEVVLAGTKSERFELRSGDCSEDETWSDCKFDRERTEVTVTNKFLYPMKTWARWSFYVPEGFPTGIRVHHNIAQIHQRGGAKGTMHKFPSKPPLLQIYLVEDKLMACLHLLSGPEDNIVDRCKYQKLANIKDITNKWTHLYVNIDTDGLLELYIDDELKFRYTDNFVPYPPENYFFKYGIYRAFLRKYNEYPMPTAIIYHDEFAVGPTKESVEVNYKNPRN